MDIRQISRWFGAVALIVGPVAVVVGTLFETSADDDSVSTSLTKIASSQGDQRVLVVADLVAAFMLPAMLYLMRLARRGAPRLAVIGGSVAFAGWLAGLVSLGGSDVLMLHAAKLPDRQAAVSLVTSVVNDPGFVGPEAVFIVGHLLGMLLLGFALWRSRAVSAWAAALVGVGSILHLLVHNLAGPVDAATYALMAVGMIACAVRLLQTVDEQWDLPTGGSPRQEGSPISISPHVSVTR